MSPTTAFLGVLWPALASLVVLLLGLALRRWRCAGEAAGAAAIAAGFIVADIFVRGVPQLVPAGATQWLPHITLILGAVGMVRALGGRTLWSFGLVAVSLGASVFVLLGPGVGWRDGSANATATLVVAAAVVAGLYLAGRHGGRMSDGWLNPLVLAILCMGGGVALAQSYVESLGRVLTGLGGALIALAIVAAWWPRTETLAGGLPVGMTLFGLCIMAGRMYTDLPTASAILLLAGAALPLLLHAPRIRRLQVPAKAALGLAGAAILAAIAVWLTPMRFDFSV